MTHYTWLIAMLALLPPYDSRMSLAPFEQPEDDFQHKPFVTVDKSQAPNTATRNYLVIRSLPGFHSEPLILKRTRGSKLLTVVGTRHIRNPDASMYRSNTVTLDAARPELILHEGDAPPDLGLETADQAIQRAADLGFIARYASQHGIAFRSADAPVDGWAFSYFRPLLIKEARSRGMPKLNVSDPLCSWTPFLQPPRPAGEK